MCWFTRKYWNSDLIYFLKNIIPIFFLFLSEYIDSFCTLGYRIVLYDTLLTLLNHCLVCLIYHFFWCSNQSIRLLSGTTVLNFLLHLIQVLVQQVNHWLKYLIQENEKQNKFEDNHTIYWGTTGQNCWLYLFAILVPNWIYYNNIKQLQRLKSVLIWLVFWRPVVFPELLSEECSLAMRW